MVKRFAKIIFFVTVTCFVLYLAVIILFTSLANHQFEKYVGEYLGRQITLGRAYVNPLTGYIHLSNLNIYESDSLPNLTVSDSVFFSAKGVSVNIAMLKLISRTFEISSLKLNQPKGQIIQSKTDFNFNDLIKKLSVKKTDTIPSRIRVSVLDVKIVNGEFRYLEKLIPINYFIKVINIDSEGKHWNSDSIATNFSFLSGSGSGSINGNFTYNLKSKDYSIAILVNKFEFDLLDQYLKDISNYGTLRANIDADFEFKGNFNDPEALSNKGILAINDFHLGKNPDDDYASFSKLVIRIKELNPKNLIYLYDSIIISQPYLKYERYDYLDNFQTMFGKDWTKITEVQADTTRFNLILKIVDQLNAIRKNLPKSDFQFNKVVIDKGVVVYNDYSQSEKFSIEANPLYIAADSILKTRNRVEIYLKSGIHPYGSLSASVSINPKNKSDFDLKYDLKGIPAALFNPFTITHASYPLDRGTLGLNGKWKVKNGKIKSNNYLLVIDPHVGKRIKNKDTDWLPMPLIMSLFSGGGNAIEYEIPITGNLKNPKFHWSNAVSDVLRNIFVKPPTTPYRALVKNSKVEIDKSLSISWKMRQKLLLSQQRRFLIKLANDLLKNPRSSIDVYPIVYAEKEMEHISFFEAKKKYFLQSKNKNDQLLSRTDSLKVNRMSVKDSLFVRYLNKQVNNNMLFTIQDKCNNFIGFATIEAKLKRMSKEREDAFLYHFKQKGVENRVTMHTEEIATPYNGFSFYKIVYKGELPKHLLEAYQKMEK